MQLAGLSELPLKFSVEKDSCVVLTGNDEERADVVTRLRGRVIIERDSSGGGVGRQARSRQRWFGCCLWGSGDGRGRDGRSRDGRR